MLFLHNNILCRKVNILYNLTFSKQLSGIRKLKVSNYLAYVSLCIIMNENPAEFPYFKIKFPNSNAF
jgi:hypothetical protein